jgi:uncharacterized protein (DUF302 family)
MCRRTLTMGLVGFVLGLLGLALGGYLGASRWMVVESESPYPFQQTVDAIVTAAKDSGWKVPKVHYLDKGLAREGYEVHPLAVIELCQPEYAAKLLAEDSTRLVSSFMPCRMSVYTTQDGRVVISRMNSGLMGHLFPSEVARVMAVASGETEHILDTAVGEVKVCGTDGAAC